MVLTILRRGLAAATLALLVLPASARAQAPAPLTVLEVPFLAQTEALCGGAAAAMVLRYWGGMSQPEEFAALIDPAAGGIRGDVLTAAVRDRGWSAVSLRGSEAAVKAHLARGRPLITLIEDRPGRHHYVVPVAWRDGTVLLHDPTLGPFQVRDAETFVTSWAAAGFWTLLVLPEAAPELPVAVEPVSAVEDVAVAAAPFACDGLVARAVTLAREGRPEAADALLQEAARRCPGAGIVHRERAALRFLDSDWVGAAVLAERAVAVSPADADAWRLLGASRFMQDDPAGALRAWNGAGEPRLDRVRFDLHGPTGAMVTSDLADVAPGELVTPARLRRARRRLESLPGVAGVRVGYVPGGSGRADVEVAVRERADTLSPASLLGNGITAAVDREIRVSRAIFAGSGARARLAWRWQPARPRLVLGLDVPRMFGRTGLWELEAAWDRQDYAEGSPDAHRSVAVRYGDWVGADTHLAAGIGIERWTAAGAYLTVTGALDQRLADDRLAVQLDARVSPAIGGADTFVRAGGTVAWRSAIAADTTAVTARAGIDGATGAAPPDAWPRAGVGSEAPVLVRAHPLLVDGVAGGALLGRHLAHAGVELRLPMRRAAPVGVSLAVFGDAGRAWHRLAAAEGPRTLVDVGVGVEIRLAEMAPAIRVDLARGLRDGAHALSVRWQAPWPGGRR